MKVMGNKEMMGSFSAGPGTMGKATVVLGATSSRPQAPANKVSRKNWSVSFLSVFPQSQNHAGH